MGSQQVENMYVHIYGGNHGTGTGYRWPYTDDYISLFVWYLLAPGRDFPLHISIDWRQIWAMSTHEQRTRNNQGGSHA